MKRCPECRRYRRVLVAGVLMTSFWISALVVPSDWQTYRMIAGGIIGIMTALTGMVFIIEAIEKLCWEANFHRQGWCS